MLFCVFLLVGNMLKNWTGRITLVNEMLKDYLLGQVVSHCVVVCRAALSC